MIHSLHLSNFKIFDRLSLPLAPFTLLSGVNSGGKSTILQSLILLNQSLRQPQWQGELLIHGSQLSLGNVKDVISESALRKEIIFGFDGNDLEQNYLIEFVFDSSMRESYSGPLKSLKINDVEQLRNNALENLVRLTEIKASNLILSSISKLCWIGAERVGPREIHPLFDRSHYHSVGGMGEDAAGMVYWYGEESLTERNLILDSAPNNLFRQVEARMAEFFPGLEIEIKKLDNVQATSLRFRSRRAGDFHYSQNVGFGITQLFPLIVALLSAKKGDIVLIENPEVHLHPKAQQQIVFFAAQVAASIGCQIIMETHSDHSLNGLRLAVKKGILPAEKLALHWFGAPTTDSRQPDIHSPQISQDGRLDQWPHGFFDQIDNALQELI